MPLLRGVHIRSYNGLDNESCKAGGLPDHLQPRHVTHGPNKRNRGFNIRGYHFGYDRIEGSAPTESIQKGKCLVSTGTLGGGYSIAARWQPQDRKPTSMVRSGCAFVLGNKVISVFVAYGCVPTTDSPRGPDFGAMDTHQLVFVSNQLTYVKTAPGSGNVFGHNEDITLFGMLEGCARIHAFVWGEGVRVDLESNPLEPIRAARVTADYIIVIKAYRIELFLVTAVRGVRKPDGPAVAPIEVIPLANPIWQADITDHKPLFGFTSSLSLRIVLRDHFGLNVYKLAKTATDSSVFESISCIPVPEESYVTSVAMLSERSGVAWIEHDFEDVPAEGWTPRASRLMYSPCEEPRKSQAGAKKNGQRHVLCEESGYGILSLCDTLSITEALQSIVVSQRYSRVAIHLVYTFSKASEGCDRLPMKLDVSSFSSRLTPDTLSVEELSKANVFSHVGLRGLRMHFTKELCSWYRQFQKHFSTS
ncbi:hypothetical protein CALCODRAFT_509597 [Calocera cornea HHB12733]|uniref:Uncharacterized protein n=1 Tax=Calocera cornea HHB12733 TaxID=1353952 RepID=A0A165F595_9BASI|nr:hypothetical protein CALCODRAFT_509597 [Calocera cornea HHB12733]